MKNRIVKNDLYLPLLKDILTNEKKDVSLTVSGNSMVPFVVSGRDTVILSPVTAPLKKGDVAFFTRDDGKFVLHRIVKIEKNGDLYFVGDSQTEIEGPIKQQAVFAVVSAIIRKKKKIEKGSAFWFFFSHIWIHTVKLRPVLFKILTFIKHKVLKKVES